jgi:hypothetical protein
MVGRRAPGGSASRRETGQRGAWAARRPGSGAPGQRGGRAAGRLGSGAAGQRGGRAAAPRLADAGGTAWQLRAGVIRDGACILQTSVTASVMGQAGRTFGSGALD